MFLDEVTDPTDFPATFESFRNLDEVLRCPICKELMKAPVLLSVCGHSFCSQCLRESLNSQEECSQCRVKANSGHIVKNVALESAVLAYDRARSELLRLVREHVTTQDSPRKASKRKLDASQDSDIQEIDEMPTAEAKRPRRASPSWRKENAPSSTGAGPSSDDVLKDKGKQQNDPSGSDAKFAECPVCNELVLVLDINAHLDNDCVTPLSAPSKKKLTSGEGRKAWQSIFNGTAAPAKKTTSSKSGGNDARGSSPPQRLAKEAYDTLKDKQLRERLRHFELPTTGSRAKLQARHERWVVIYNANLDQAPERQTPISVLKTQLQAWEQGREKDEKEKTKAQERAGAGTAGVDHTEYEARHRTQFRSLIEQARASKAGPIRPISQEPEEL